jgi:hypothetical protein
MSDLYLRGGFGGGTEHLSPSLQARIAAADAAYDRETARQRREAEELQAMRQAAAVDASIRAAIERGEDVDLRRAFRDGGIGHTPAERIAIAAARQDWEDARERARQQAAYRKWLLEQSDNTSADMTAPTAAEKLETEQMAARVAEIRAKRRERSKTIVAARGLARMDREGR